ncbi:TPM domain-containing protein [Myxococcus sp. K15C18031901]|uniref:TPM domain-containing protein n=1 Tax=Myxococcus dinghuensis TaxID=2906761 RepID=UPI0020A7DA49|nr:TPM domain-containing protein [Myxococcus dinghuensis]MCP3100604.1 TPM domain-containing protein [Myxococcus dinghuensis]
MVKTALLLLVPLLTLAVPVPRITQPVEDLAGVLPSQDHEAVSGQLLHLGERTGAQMAVLLVETTSGEPIEDFALRAAEAWKGGSPTRNDGLLLVVAVKDRRLRLEVGYGLEASLPDGIVRSILDAQAPLFAREDWRGGLTNIVEQLLQRLERGDAEPPNTPSGPASAAEPHLAPRLEPPGASFLMMLVLAAVAGIARSLPCSPRSKRARGLAATLMVLVTGVVTALASWGGQSISIALGLFGALTLWFFLAWRLPRKQPPSARLVAIGTPLVGYLLATPAIAKAPTWMDCATVQPPVVFLLLAFTLRYSVGIIANAIPLHLGSEPRVQSLTLKAMIRFGYLPEYLRLESTSHQRLDRHAGEHGPGRYDPGSHPGGHLGGGEGGWSGGGGGNSGGGGDFGGGGSSSSW